MARLNIIGFETGDASEGTLGGTSSIQGTTKRTGNYALRVNPTTTGGGTFTITKPTATTTTTFSVADVWTRFYFRYDTKPASGSEELFVARDTAGALKLALRLDSAGKISAWDKTGTTQLGSTGTTVLNSGTWYRIEIFCGTGASANYEVRIDGVTELSGTGDLNTVNHGTVRLGKNTNRNSQSVDFFYDDVAIDDAAWPGVGEIRLVLPTGDGSYTTWTGTYADVDEVPHDSDTTFITSPLVIGNAETVQLQDCAAVGITGAIATVKACAIVRRDGGTNGAIRLRVRSGSTDSDTGANFGTPSSYTLLSALHLVDPATGATWTTSGIDALELGVVERSSTNASRTTLLCAMVESASGTVHEGSGTITGSGTATGSGQLVAGGAGDVEGSGTVSGSGTALLSGVGSAQGEGAATGDGALIAGGAGAVSGDATATGTPTLVTGASGAAQGEGSAAGDANLIAGGAGSAAGDGAASGAGSIVAGGAGSAQGDATASGAADEGEAPTPAGRGLPLLEYEVVHRMPSAASLLALEGFRFDGVDYLGVQPSAWQSSEESWDNGDPAYPQTADTRRGLGRWFGPGAIHARPGALWLSGVAVEEETLGHDKAARVASGALPIAIWEYEDPSLADLDKAIGGALIRLILQNAATGALITNQLLPFTARHFQLPSLNSHAVLWMRIEGAERPWRMPPDYLSVRGFSRVPDKFKYRINGTEYIWDFEADVGRRPSDKNQQSLTGLVLWDEYNKLVTNGGLLHRGAWTQYISDAAPQDGPWSALRIAVGDDEFVVGEAFQPAPGAVLHRVDNAATRTPVLVDPLALSVSCWHRLTHEDRLHDAEVAGTIATRSGPATALWRFTPGQETEVELLGVTARNYVPVCEASLYPTVTDLRVYRRRRAALGLPDDKTTLVLSYSHLYEYEPDALTVNDRLPGLPRETMGHPGGRCLRELDNTQTNTLRFFTEYFGSVGAPRGGDRFAQFYNTLRTLDARQRATSGQGTVFHGDNCAEICWGAYYGWAQDKPFGDSEAQQYLAIMQDGVWDNAGLAGFPATAYRWQRLRALSTARGTVLVASGKEATSERALWGVADGTRFREAALPFRARRLTPVIDEDGKQWLYCVGRFVTEVDDEISLLPQWSLIRLSGAFVTIRATWNADAGDNGGFCMSKSEAMEKGVDPSKLPPFLRWITDALMPAGGYWLPADSEPDEPYLALNIGSTTICYLLFGTLPYDPNIWPHLDFPVYDDGGIGDEAILPVPGCQHAQCVIDTIDEHPPDDLPDGWTPTVQAIIVQKLVSRDAWTAIHVCDVNEFFADSGQRLLQYQSRWMPNLWGRFDSDEDAEDLTTYTVPLTWDRFFSLPREAHEKIEVVALAFEGSGGETGVRAPAILRRN